MAQDKDEIKIIPARSISRENMRRDLMAERPVLEVKNQPEKDNGEKKIARRNLFKQLIPLSGKALVDFMRETSMSSEDVSTGISNIKKSD
ncbi:MAG: hypothetical protein SGI74_06125 [Oligoflexia bacterium]|nr:hypothetical protein [Oligoflexia bacterium]